MSTLRRKKLKKYFNKDRAEIFALSDKGSYNNHTTEKSRKFDVNRASVLGFRTVDGGHGAASKLFSFHGL